MKFSYIISAFSILFLSYWIYTILYEIDVIKTVEETNVNDIDCYKVKHSLPIEDFVKINETFLIGSSFNVPELFHDLKYLTEKTLKNDMMISFNLESEDQEKVRFVPLVNFPEKVPFHPHGMDLMDEEFIYVINHSFSSKISNERVELFRIRFDGGSNEPVKLLYIRSFLLPRSFFGTLNAIAGIDQSSFYFTTSGSATMPLGASQNNLFYRLKYVLSVPFCVIFNLKFTAAFHFKEGEITAIKETAGIMNNGIIYDKENKRLFVAQTLDKKLIELDTKNGERKPTVVKVVKSQHGYDNIYYDKSKQKIYGTIIPKLYQFTEVVEYYKRNKRVDLKGIYGGFQSIDLKNDYIIKIEHISTNKLNLISSATYFNDGKAQILTSSMDNGLLVCRVRMK